MMKTVVIVIAENNFRDEEYLRPKEVLQKAGHKVITASTQIQKATGTLGLIVNPDILLENVNTDNLDALIFIGGSGAKQYFDDKLAQKLASEAMQKGKIYGAICIAPAILANAGLLKGKRATSFSSVITAIKEKGAIFTGEDVVIDGHLVTAKGPEVAKQFGEAIVKLLQE